MRNGRIRFWRTVKAAGGDRVRLLYPSIEKQGEKERDSTYTMIHSKIMVIDDWFLRVGSANLNNRSMGADTECDLAIVAESDRERATIVRLRDRLLGEHCGVSAEEVAAALAQQRSLVRVADSLCGNGHCLSPIDDGQPDRTLFARLAERIADPARPLRLGRLAGRLLPRLLFHGSRTIGRRLAKREDRRTAASKKEIETARRPANGGESEEGILGSAGLMVAGAIALIVVLTLAWQFTGLKELAQPDHIRELLEEAQGEPWALGVVVALFLLGGAVAFPVTILILATAAVFGPWWGMLYATAGVAASAGLMFAIGARFGQGVPRRLLGKRWDRLRDRLQRRGLVAVVALRVVPVAPFSLINLAAGAGSIRLVDFALGTLIGMGPGLAAIALMGDRIVKVFADPSASQIAVLALCVAGWIGLSFGAQAIVSRLGERTS